MKKILIILLAVIFAISIPIMGVSCPLETKEGEDLRMAPSDETFPVDPDDTLPIDTELVIEAQEAAEKEAARKAAEEAELAEIAAKDIEADKQEPERLFPEDWIEVTVGVGSPKEVLNRILFSSYHDGDTCDINTIRPNGNDMQPLCDSGYNDSEACWDSDYSGIILVSDCGGEDDRDLYECNIATCETESIVDRVEGCDFSPDPHPDGISLVFCGFLDDSFEIFLRGSPVKQLTDNSDWDAFPHFSPNGETIIFSSNRDGYSKLYTMDTDGNNVVRITNGGEYSDWNGSFSPDGTKIAFMSDRGGNIDIWVMPVGNPDGAINLTNNPADDVSPDWSPDGEMIVFASNRDETDKNMLDIFVMDANGENQTNITPDLKDSYQGEPNW